MTNEDKITLLETMYQYIQDRPQGFCTAYVSATAKTFLWYTKIEHAMLCDIPELEIYKPTGKAEYSYWFSVTHSAHRLQIIEKIIKDLKQTI